MLSTNICRPCEVATSQTTWYIPELGFLIFNVSNNPSGSGLREQNQTWPALCASNDSTTVYPIPLDPPVTTMSRFSSDQPSAVAYCNVEAISLGSMF
jgi:hypothetical protein